MVVVSASLAQPDVTCTSSGPGVTTVHAVQQLLLKGAELFLAKASSPDAWV